ncbi:MAG: tRNA (adenosine(37)-N6)-dimethylallyltransferase MiaA [bacterium]|nr:tRNA (adenosine(37)-N6)-dimethylallyltransferase MiaA [bacterium]
MPEPKSSPDPLRFSSDPRRHTPDPSSGQDQASTEDKKGTEHQRPNQDDNPDPDRWVHPPLADCFYLTGPTASGKTQLAVELARHLDAEIISMDSMAIYQDMDIGTAKPSADQREQVPHHLIDVVRPTDSYSVSNFVTDAARIASQIRSRGKRVLICGGTPLYLKSLLRGLFLGPAADWDFRNAVEEDLRVHGEASLMSRLQQVDPLLAHKLHPHDHRRIIRALEVAKVTSRPLSHWQLQFETPADRQRFPAVVLGIDRKWLHERINQRVDAMLQSGLVDETRDLLSTYGQLGRTAAQAVGYREVLLHLRQATPLEDTRESIRAHTRQFARRQEIWFRGLSELKKSEVTPDKPLSQLVEEVLEIFQQGDL